MSRAERRSRERNSRPQPSQPAARSKSRAEPADALRRLTRHWRLALVILVTAVTFAHAVRFPFSALSDRAFVLDNPLAANPAAGNPLGRGLAALWRGSPGQSPSGVGALSLALDTRIFGADPAPFHAINLALHLLNVVLVYLLLLRWGVTIRLAGVAVALFALHPVVAQPVCWISGRNELLATAMMLAALLAAIRVKPGAGEPAAGFKIAAAIFGGLAVCAGLPMVIAPLLLWFVIRQACPSWKSAGVLTVVGPVVVADVVATIPALRLAYPGAAGLTAAVLHAIPNALAALTIRIEELFWPRGLLAQYYRAPGDPSAVAIVLVAGAVAALTAYAAWGAVKRSPQRTAMLFLLIAYLPASGAFTGTRWITDAGLYLPLVGITLVLATIIPKYWPELAGLPMLVPVLAILSWSQSLIWADPNAALAAIVAQYPDEPRALNNLAFAELGEPDRVGSAVQAFVNLDQSFPDFPSDRGQRAWAYSYLGDHARSGAIVEGCVRDHDVQCAFYFWVDLTNSGRNPQDISPALMGAAYDVTAEALEQNYDPNMLRTIAGWLRGKGLEDRARRVEAAAAQKEARTRSGTAASP
jgi:protein O-mannosyl-transferase